MSREYPIHDDEDFDLAAQHQKQLEERQAQEEMELAQRLLREDKGYDEWLTQLTNRSEDL